MRFQSLKFPFKNQLLNSKWFSAILSVDFAFQPIVNIHTGVCYGYEALLRNYNTGEFESIHDFFEQAYCDHVLYPVDLALRQKAIEKFSTLEWKNHVKLFFNLDNRVLNTRDYKAGNTLNILNYYDLSQDTICFEISEKHELKHDGKVNDILNAYRAQGFKIAVDDYGIGFAGLKLLYYTRPDFIKVDRFFIQDITYDMNKRLFVSSIVNMAHIMGSIVIAEGIETKAEFYTCRNIGFDLIQGYLIQHPVTDMNRLRRGYDHIRALSDKEQRKDKSGDKKLIDIGLEYIDPIFHHCDVNEAFKRFKNKPDTPVFPVVNKNHEPLGAVSQVNFKEYTYSRFGAELLQNPSLGKNLSRFITKYPIADIHTPVEKILEIYSNNEMMEGIIIVDNLKYKGFLSARSLLRILNEKNIAIARDQNPLTGLPGNTMIYKYISEALDKTDAQYVFVYFDFDHFKPYNDKYGFRQGDRVITLFSDILKSWTQYAKRFAGHIGGDDFFVGVSDTSLEKVYSDVIQMAKQFKREAESFYDPESLEKGYITTKDREGNLAPFPLMTVSSVILELPANRRQLFSIDEISNLMSRNKKAAKLSLEKVHIAKIDDRWLSTELN